MSSGDHVHAIMYGAVNANIHKLQTIIWLDIWWLGKWRSFILCTQRLLDCCISRFVAIHSLRVLSCPVGFVSLHPPRRYMPSCVGLQISTPHAPSPHLRSTSCHAPPHALAPAHPNALPQPVPPYSIPESPHISKPIVRNRKPHVAIYVSAFVLRVWQDYHAFVIMFKSNSECFVLADRPFATMARSCNSFVSSLPCLLMHATFAGVTMSLIVTLMYFAKRELKQGLVYVCLW